MANSPLVRISSFIIACVCCFLHCPTLGFRTNDLPARCQSRKDWYPSNYKKITYRQERLTTVGNNSDGSDTIRKPRVEIEYCPGCKWLLRSGWLAQELLSTFESDIGEVAIQPSDISGKFQIRVDGQIVWDRKNEGGFPEAKVLKQRVRDEIAPERNLGHSEAKSTDT